MSETLSETKSETKSEKEESTEEEKEQQKEELFRLNKERVLFTLPTVKHIVSPHSGSILSQEEPILTLDDQLSVKCSEEFEKIAEEGSIVKSQIPGLLVSCGFQHDVKLLTKVVEEFYSGAEQLEINQFLDFVSKFHAPAYHYGERLRKNVSRGQHDAVTSCIVRNCDPNTSDGEGTSSLHYCCEFNRPDIMELLAKLCKSKLVVDAQDRYGWSPLHSAAHQGNKNCTALLIKLGANVNIVNNVGKSPLHIAAAQNRGAILELLLAARGDLNLQDKIGMTALHEAAYRGQNTLYNELSQHPTANLTIRDILGNTPIDYCDSN